MKEWAISLDSFICVEAETEKEAIMRAISMLREDLAHTSDRVISEVYEWIGEEV